MLPGHLFQAAKYHAFRQTTFGKGLVIESIIHHKIQGSAHIRHIALEHFIRIDRNSQAIQVQTKVWFKILAYIRIFVLLHFAGRESDSLKIGKGSSTRRIQHFSAMFADHSFRLREEFYILLFRIHRHSPTSFFIQSYPFSSSSRASSGPAVFTIRPL